MKKIQAAILPDDDFHYLCFEGTAAIEKPENGAVVETAAEESAVWELIYIGKAGADRK